MPSWDGFKQALLGGMNASTNPSNYHTPYQHQGQIEGMINSGYANAGNRQAPNIDPAFRNAQLQQMQQLQGIAAGTQQGAGELAAQRQAQNSLAMQQAGARMARGGNAGNALLGAQRQMAGIGANAAGQSQQAALQDQQAAQGLLAQVGAQGRAGDLGVGQLQQNQMSINDQAQLQYLSQLTGMDQAQLMAQIQAMQAATQQQGMLGGLLQAGGTLGGAAIMHSDERLKTDVRDGADDVDQALAALRPKSYRYRDEKHGKGERVGIMAQDLEKSKMGRLVVFEAKDGKALDVNKALSLSLAANARLHERVSKLEGKK